MPSLRNSPWMRGAPQSGLARAILSMRARIAASIRGRPERFCSERVVHRCRSHWRCQRNTVSGRTISKALRQSRHEFLSRIQKSRSCSRSCGRFAVRVNAANCCRARGSRVRQPGALDRVVRWIGGVRRPPSACEILSRIRGKNQSCATAIRRRATSNRSSPSVEAIPQFWEASSPTRPSTSMRRHI
jgi:hypothetical protein